MGHNDIHCARFCSFYVTITLDLNSSRIGYIFAKSPLAYLSSVLTLQKFGLTPLSSGRFFSETFLPNTVCDISKMSKSKI